MKALWKTLLPILLVVAASRPLPAAGLLFTFQGDTAAAAVHDADSLRLLANPPVGFGATQVFGIPDPAAAHGFGKFFVLGRDAVVVLDGEFKVRRTLPLSQALPPGAGSGVLIAAGARLVLAAGSQIVVIDTAQESVLTTVQLDFTARALAVLPGTQRVFVVAEGSVLLREIDLGTYQIKESAALLPQAMTAVAAAPNGSQVYGVAAGALYDLGSLASVRLVPASAETGLSGAVLSANGASPSAAPLGTPAGQIQKIALSDSGRYVMLSGNRVLQGWLSGPSGVAEVNLVNGGLVSGLAASDIALSANGRTLFAVSAARSALYKLDLDHPGSVASAALSFSPSTVALVSPEVGQAAGMLQQVSSTQLTVAGGKTFSLDVKALSAAGAGQADITVFASSITPANPTVECLPDITGAGGIGGLYCTAGAVTSSTLVRITASDTTGRTAPSFEVTVAPPTATEGLAKIGGDFEVVPENFDFQLVVAASKNRVAQAGLSLTITSVPTRPTVTCPPQIVTAANGQAVIQCRSGVVTVPGSDIKAPKDVAITVTDGSRSVVFSITIDPNKTLREGLTKISGDGQKIAQGIDLPFPLVVRSVVDGVALVNERLTVSVNVPTALMCPIFAFTDADGFAFIHCKGGTVFGESLVLVTIGGPRGSQVQFTVTVRASSSGIATKLDIVTAGPIQAVVGEVRPNAVRVIASDGSGQRVAGKKVFFHSANGVTFDPAQVNTDGLGEATTTVTFGCSNRNRGTIEVGFAADETEDDIDFTLTTGPFASVQKLQGDNQTGSPGQTLTAAALLVQVGDMCGNPITNQRVAWRANPEARATFRNVVDITNPSGRSSVLVQLGSYGGPFTVTAQAGEVSAAFNLNVALDPSQLRRLSGDGQTVAAGTAAAQPLVVEVAGSNGFGVSNVDVAFAVTQGTATLSRPASKSDGLGLGYTNVTLGDPSGPVKVTATAIGQTVTFTLQPGTGGGPKAPLEGFVNGASFQAGWVPGSLGTIFGTGITGAPGIQSADKVPFPTALGGVSVTVNGIQAPIISLVNVGGQEQINLQVPFGVQAPGKATVVVNNNGASVTVSDVPLLRAQPGIFEFALNGTLLAAALHADFSVVTPDNPARPGEIIQLFLTGLGPTDPAVATNAPGPVPAARTVLDPVVGLDNAGVENFGGFYAPTLVTAYQVNFRVSDNAQSGNRELNVVVDGVSSKKSLLPVLRP